MNDLNLKLPMGCVCGFLGPNGAGKSTTIRMIMSIIYPDRGAIDVLGSDALHRKDRIGYLPEERGLYRKMRVGEYLEYVAKLKGVDGRECQRRVKHWLERIELPGVIKKKCQELSKGMQQKVQFLAAIIHDPDLLILDEPFSGLDPVNAALLNKLIQEFHQQGKTVVFSTHVLFQAEQICDRFVLINKGVKLLDSTLEEIRAQFDPRTIMVEPLNGRFDVDGIAGIKNVRRVADSTRMEVQVEESVDRHEVMKRIVEREPVRSIELRQLSLEEVFVRLVRSDRGEEAAAQAREELSHV
ncbi:MAG TPA: ATP-binding cassette domain-containing protein [Phycisphaerales bacterium]|nr:ATP-binding cassette domain-containing protein [Phycisphaerales bacterium]